MASKHAKKHTSPRKERKQQKAQARLQKDLKNPKIGKIRRLVYFGMIATFILIIGLSTGNVLNKYNKTIDWKVNNSNVIALADQDPNLINEQNPKIRNAIMNFTKTYLKIYNEKTHDFTKHATDKNIEKFKTAYANIPDQSKSFYKARYDLISNKYVIEKAYRNLFSNYPKVLKDDVTPLKIKELNDKTFPAVYQFEQENGSSDKFVKRIYKLQKQLTSDANSIDKISGILGRIIIGKNKNTFIISNMAYDKDINQIYEIIDNLNFRWNDLTLTDALVSASTKTIEYQLKKHNKWADYKNDISEHENAVAEFNKQKETDRANKEQANEEAKAKVQQEINNVMNEIQQRKDRIARRNATVVVPDFNNKSIDYIKDWVSEKGLHLEITYQETSDIIDGGKIAKITPNVNGKLYKGFPGEDVLRVTIYKYVASNDNSNDSNSNSSSNSSSSSSSR